MLISGILEWILGNTYPATVFSSFGGFYLTFGGILNPSFAAFSSYAPPNAKSAAEGMTTEGFNASLGTKESRPYIARANHDSSGFFLLAMAILSIIYLICSLRTNVAFVIIFLTLVPALFLLVGAFWVWAEDYTANTALAQKLCQVS
jgi:succinate-acetate transporter protein